MFLIYFYQISESHLESFSVMSKHEMFIKPHAATSPLAFRETILFHWFKLMLKTDSVFTYLLKLQWETLILTLPAEADFVGGGAFSWNIALETDPRSKPQIHLHINKLQPLKSIQGYHENIRTKPGIVLRHTRGEWWKILPTQVHIQFWIRLPLPQSRLPTHTEELSCFCVGNYPTFRERKGRPKYRMEGLDVSVPYLCAIAALTRGMVAPSLLS